MSSGHSYGAMDAGASQYLYIEIIYIYIYIYMIRNKLFSWQSFLLRVKKITYLGSRPHTEPDILPPGPESISDHFFHLEIDVFNYKYKIIIIMTVDG